MEIGPEMFLIVLPIVEVHRYVEVIIVSDKVLEHSKFIVISHLIIHLNYHLQYTQSILGIMNGLDYLKMVPKYIANNLVAVLVVKIFVEKPFGIELLQKRQYLIILVAQLQ